MTSVKVIRFGLLALCAGLVMSGTAYAQSTGWMNANDMHRFSKAHFHDGAWPTSVSCKDAEVVAGMDRRNMLLNIEYGPNPNHTKWKWAWGPAVGRIEHDYAAKGFKMVSQDSFRRPSGLLIRCAIWHKQP
jgi:hypothetical protein